MMAESSRSVGMTKKQRPPLRNVARDAGVGWKHNPLRRAFMSSPLAKIKHVDRVARALRLDCAKLRQGLAATRSLLLAPPVFVERRGPMAGLCPDWLGKEGLRTP